MLSEQYGEFWVKEKIVKIQSLGKITRNCPFSWTNSCCYDNLMFWWNALNLSVKESIGEIANSAGYYDK